MGMGIFVVDDDEAIRDTLRLVLEDAGYSVTEAGDGISALAQLPSVPTPCIVILDLIMPGLSGVEMLSRIAADPTLREDHAYVLMTAAQSATLQPLEPLLSALDVLTLEKPFELDHLLDVVARAAASLGG